MRLRNFLSAFAIVAALATSTGCATAPPVSEKVQSYYEANRTLAPVMDYPLVSFLGDSFTAGTNFGGIKEAGWPAIVSARHEWRRDMQGVGGTGFVNGLEERKNFGSRVDDIIAVRPAMVIVAGGGNDYRQDKAKMLSEATAVITRLQKGLPDAKIVLIAPLWLQQEDPESLPDLIDVSKRVAAATGVVRIDPAGWLRGQPNLLGADGVHPTDEGHKVLADLIDAALIKSGVPLPVPTVQKN